MKSRSVSITGATGFIGTHAVRAFRTHGWKVLAIVRPGSEKTVPDGAAVRHADLLSQGALTAAFAGSEVVVHAAGLVRAASSDELQSVNVGATRAVVAAANAVGARLVHLSSLAAIGPGTPEHPTREDDPPQPVNAYGRSKLAAEAMVRSTATVPWTILRPSAVYGPGDRGFLPLVRLARPSGAIAYQAVMPDENILASAGAIPALNRKAFGN
jgi:nucleoside-diphosphate-sugar epimerase